MNSLRTLVTVSYDVPCLALLSRSELASFCLRYRASPHSVLRNAALMGECLVKSRILGEAGSERGRRHYEDRADLIYQTSLAGIVSW